MMYAGVRINLTAQVVDKETRLPLMPAEEVSYLIQPPQYYYHCSASLEIITEAMAKIQYIRSINNRITCQCVMVKPLENKNWTLEAVVTKSEVIT